MPASSGRVTQAVASREPWTVILNPAALNGRAVREWAELEGAFRRSGIPAHVVATEYPGHATELTVAAVRAGARRIVVAGGSGTWHEAVNGVFIQDAVDRRELTLVRVPVKRDADCDIRNLFEYPEAKSLFASGYSFPVPVIGIDYCESRFTQRRYATSAIAGRRAARHRAWDCFRRDGYVAMASGELPLYMAAALEITGPAVITVDEFERYRGTADNISAGIVYAADAGCRLERGASHAASSPQCSAGGPDHGVFIGSSRNPAPSNGWEPECAAHKPEGIGCRADIELVVETGECHAARFEAGRDVGAGVSMVCRTLSFRGRRITIESESPLPVLADGELFVTTPVTLELVPDAFRTLAWGESAGPGGSSGRFGQTAASRDGAGEEPLGLSTLR